MSDSFVFSEILPINSIVNPNVPASDYLDLQQPFSFFDFLKYTESELTPLQFNDLYVQYLKTWGEIKENTKNQIDSTIQDRYFELLKEITLKYSTSDEKRFLSNIDYTDPSDLDVIIPFYSKKIREICSFYSEKREKLKFKIEKNKSKGTSNSLQESIYETITDVIFSDALEVVDYQKLVNEETLLKDLNIEIEELYDLYTNYLDNDPTQSYELYDVKTELRKTLYSSNINAIDANIFINLDQAITNQIFDKVYVFLNQIGKNFAVNYDLNAVNLNCKPDDKLFKIVNENKPKATRLVQLRYELIKKYIGCDFYYIATGSNVSDTVSTELLFKASNPSGNLLNRHFPTTASIEEESDLHSCRRIGLFFTPDKSGVLYFSVPEKKYKVDYSKLEPNKLYIFPDPDIYGNTMGLTRNYNTEYPLIHVCDYNKSVHNQSYFYAEGDINSNPYTQDFYAYFSRNQLKDSVYFGKDGLKSNFSSLYNKGVITKWNSDIYGNQFALIKNKSKKNLINNSTVDDSMEYFYDDYCGGPITYSDNESLPEEIYANQSSWVKPNVWASDYYYNILIEGGIGNIISGLMERPALKYPLSVDGLVLDRINKLDIDLFDITLNDGDIINYNVIDGDAYNNPTLIDFKWVLNDSYGFNSPYTYAIDLLYYKRDFNNIITKPSKELDGNVQSATYEGEFTYNYVLSSIKYRDMDCGPILRLDGDAYNFEEKTKFIINEVVSENKTVLDDVVVQDNLNSYQIRNSYGAMFVKDIITGNISELSSALSKQFNTKSTELQDELNTQISDFNIYNDFIWIRTKNTIVFEKLIYENTGYKYSGTGDNYITYPINSFTNNISNPFIFENKDYCMFVLLSTISGISNSFSIVPFIYKVDYTTCKITLISSLSTTQESINSYKNNSAINNVKLNKLNKPVLFYNTRNNKYGILATIEDQNEFPYLYKVLFDYNGLNISNEESSIYDMSSFTTKFTKNAYDNPNIITDLNIQNISNSTVIRNAIEGSIIFS